MRATSLLRHSRWDGVFVALSLLQGAWLVAAPSTLLVALGLWWNANTVSHNFVHLPFFRSRWPNAAFAAYLTLVLGFPQELWKQRHLQHHAGRHVTRVRWTTTLAAQSVLLAMAWTAAAIAVPRVFLYVYLPGWIAGLLLCAMQGHFEHARGTTSHYGRVYNTLFFNDGWHVEHHARPGEHWTRLPQRVARDAETSAWPPVLRWIESVPALLDVLERIVIRSPVLQRFVLRRHERAFRVCASRLPTSARVVIIGGGLFPRTALVIRRLYPAARVTIIDSNPRHLHMAGAFLGDTVTFIAARYEPAHAVGADLVVVPLAFVGDRGQFYTRPPAASVLVHDWLWRPRGEGARISWLLLKRVNMVRREAPESDAAARLSA